MLNSEVIYGGISAFVLSVIISPIFIPILHKLKFGQNVRDDGPKTHLIKSGTPTMGGIIMLAVLLIVGCYFGKKYSIIFYRFYSHLDVL
jgi:phospho-N-acetylmuramoyl-pentapeptide-transferase